MMSLTVNLMGPSPWGFRISGGRDFKKAITVSKVNSESKAEKADLQPGDIIVEINGENTADMLNVEAQNKIKNSQTQLQLLVDRPDPPSPGQTNGITTPDQLLGRFQEAVQVSRDENQNYREYSLSSPASLSPGPYSPEPLLSPYQKTESITPTSAKSLQLRSWSLEEKTASHRLSRPLSQELSPTDFRSNSVSSRTPTPPGLYSPHSPIERELPMSPRRSSDFAMQRFDRDSEVYKMIQENKESRTTPRQSNTFRMLQEVLEADEKEAAIRFPGNLSPSPVKTNTVAGVHKYHTCEKCGTNIVTQAVRIMDDRYRHPECYTCTQCGLNLKMRGHFWVDDEMFCEKHARERYQGPGSNAPRRFTVSPNH
ncbi:PDZ and LIM domain protein 2 isoform X2 [Denticeps clupeoides]|uniref:PDZ and LIM domain protein 2 n=1 Tax=Denticeps clupeoides TaxID=299321 RepID=A0AAY4EWA1_9TELE|nr:PDZ and LIM domain protein 2 isoform X2 [Denticeps clupeoides]